MLKQKITKDLKKVNVNMLTLLVCEMLRHSIITVGRSEHILGTCAVVPPTTSCNVAAVQQALNLHIIEQRKFYSCIYIICGRKILFDIHKVAGLWKHPLGTKVFI